MAAVPPEISSPRFGVVPPAVAPTPTAMPKLFVTFAASPTAVPKVPSVTFAGKVALLLFDPLTTVSASACCGITAAPNVSKIPADKIPNFFVFCFIALLLYIKNRTTACIHPASDSLFTRSDLPLYSTTPCFLSSVSFVFLPFSLIKIFYNGYKTAGAMVRLLSTQ